MDKSKSVLLCRGLLLVFTLTLIFVFTGCESGKEELLEEGRLQAKENERRIAAGNTFVFGLCDNGTLVRSEGASEAIDEWKDIVEVDAAGWTVAGVCFDGTVVFTTEENGMEDFDTSFWTDVVAVNVSSATIVGLKSDGTVVATGDNFQGQCNTASWKNTISIKAKWSYSVGLSLDGDIYAKGAIRGVSKGAPVEKIQNPVALAVSERSFFCITEEGKIMGIGTSPLFDSLPELPFLWKQARPFT